ncbi:ras GTPase-activating protein-binding protein 1-like [Limulus polyphemus]|uniref:Ras GTPase-activating protein-binding protein 1-like n=1 Tax=Limulus polyphemus TaxID=6850 RepID=A0ABM1B3Z4_LIMPO|nr:ras GTPase-activating protein-binding protein 1-like [Limulus polyphemus]XP_022241567.1 ras GTPase-activating protein-binding protein 1-like [Limulus polyphemus]
MVMETPSPQCVGREFVRQYYTVLNMAPIYLHRFYSHNSSFVHGALDNPGQESKPVVGQQAIHQKIMQLKFGDCRAKILQVDSHETLGDGVVVQVTGKLSNNGQDMRPFVQTFVLAPQSPKKYYVRNDIFRYQDYLYDEDEETDDQVVDVDREVEEPEMSSTPPLKAVDPAGGDFEPDIISPPNGISHDMESCPTARSISPAVPQEVECPLESEVDTEIEVEPQKSEWDMPDESFTSEEKISHDLSEPDESAGALQPEPKTYANMVSKNAPGAGGICGTVSAGATILGPVDNALDSQPKPDVPVFTKVHPSGGVTSNSSPSLGSSGSPNTVGESFQGQRMPRASRNLFQGMNRGDVRETTPNSVSGRTSGTPEAEGRKMGMLPYPDCQQLFVGNLPHTISEEELKDFFSKYGRVLEMRINTKPPQKMNGGTKVPNFGFIVMDDPADVTKILQMKPIYFNNHRLNVEEKKTKPREQRPGGGGDGRLGGGKGGMMGRSRFGGRGMGRGDRGGGRGNYFPRR